MIQIKAYYQYWRKRVDAHGIHSPFVFDFYNSVLLKAPEVKDKPISLLMSRLKKDERTLEVTDFGAGSKSTSSSRRKISAIAKTAAINRKYGRLLSRIVDRYQFSSIIELGTSLGIGTLYLSQPACVKKIITIEGSPEIAEIASKNFSDFGVKPVEQLVGKFDDKLEAALAFIPKPDLVYVDGNHQYEATLKYFHFFIDQLSDNGFVIFDDIYWSEGMEKAWKEICASPKINVSIDLFRMGIVCKRPGQAKQHFILKY